MDWQHFFEINVAGGEEWGVLSAEFILLHIPHDEIVFAKANQAKRGKKKEQRELRFFFFCGRAVLHVLFCITK